MNLNLTLEETLKLALSMNEAESFAVDYVKRLLPKKEKAIEDGDLKAILNYNTSLKTALEDAKRHYKWCVELQRQILLRIKEQNKDKE